MDQIFSKRNISGLRSKSKHPVRILHIRNSLGIEFHFKWTFLNIWTKIDERRSFHIITLHFLMRKAEICSFSERVLIEKNSWTLFASIASVITISIFQSRKCENLVHLVCFNCSFQNFLNIGRALRAKIYSRFQPP